MKLSILLVLAVLFAGCQPQYFFYHSQADIPHKTQSVTSEMRLITMEEHPFNLGVIAAVDINPVTKEKIYYILIAPGRATTEITELNEVSASYGGVIYPDKVREFIDGLDEIIKDWNKKYSEKDGFTYNFYSAPEQEVKPVSENVALWNPSFEFNYYNTNDERLARVILGSGELKNAYYIRGLTTMMNFQTLLNMAVKELYTMGYKS